MSMTKRQRARYLREVEDKSQRETAREVGVSKTTIARWERQWRIAESEDRLGDLGRRLDCARESAERWEKRWRGLDAKYLELQQFNASLIEQREELREEVRNYSHEVSDLSGQLRDRIEESEQLQRDLDTLRQNEGGLSEEEYRRRVSEDTEINDMADELGRLRATKNTNERDIRILRSRLRITRRTARRLHAVWFAAGITAVLAVYAFTL